MAREKFRKVRLEIVISVIAEVRALNDMAVVAVPWTRITSPLWPASTPLVIVTLLSPPGIANVVLTVYVLEVDPPEM